GETAESADRFRCARIIKVDRIRFAGFERLRKIDKNGSRITSVFQGGGAHRYLVDVEVIVEVKLNAVVVTQHFESNRVLASDGFLVGINTNIETVRKQIVIRTILTVFTAQNVGTRRRTLRCLSENRGRDDRKNDR